VSKQQLEKHILTYNDKACKNVEIIVKDKDNKPDLYHTSTCGSIKQFIPRISERQMEGEDRSVPRVVTATSLIGCILGYACAGVASTITDYTDIKDAGEKDTDWKNGYYIYKFEFDTALKPTEKLIPHCDSTDEHWLVAHSPDTNEYKGTKIGKFFVKQFIYKTKEDKPAQLETTILLEVSDSQGLQISKNKHVDKGYWLIELPVGDKQAWINNGWTQDDSIKIQAIDKTEYFANKEAIASLLSHDEQMPAYAKW
jgi:hypothetical protein